MDVLETLQAHGVTVFADGRDLRLRPADRLTDDLIALVRANKLRLLEALRQNAHPPYRLILKSAEAAAAIAAIPDGATVALDTETSGLGVTDRVRLLQLYDGTSPVVIIDWFKASVDQGLLEKLVQRATVVAHNAVFDAGMLRLSTPLECTMLLSHAITGRSEKLAVLALRHLDRVLPKEAQTADWTMPLTASMLGYATKDAVAVFDLWPVLRLEAERSEALDVYRLMQRAQPAIVEMQLRGVPFDRARHAAIVATALERKDELEGTITENGIGNPRSSPQIANWLERFVPADWPLTPSGRISTAAAVLRSRLQDVAEDARAAVAGLLEYREKAVLTTTHGTKLAEHVRPSGRIHPHLHIGGTVTGRMSCSEPNLQNIPRDPEFRACFRAPEGRRIVAGDFGQIELRVAAIIAREDRMLDAFESGEDVHRLTASKLLGRPSADVTKDERQLAKAVNFGLLYGQSARGLSRYAAANYGVAMSVSQAEYFRNGWFTANPKIAAWQRHQRDRVGRTKRAHTPAGRVRDLAGYEFWYTRALNTPIQGGAAEVMLAALGRLPEALDGLDAFPILVIHDEILLEAAITDAAEAFRRLESAMVAGYREVFPEGPTTGLVESGIGMTWAEAKK
jgi:DNA polymerase-1